MQSWTSDRDPHEQSKHFFRIACMGVSLRFSLELGTLLGSFSRVSAFTVCASFIITALRLARYQ